jgi:hypothetical protein
MRPATYYYLAQAWSSRRRGEARPGPSARVTRRGRHAQAPRRSHARRELHAAARRVLAVLSGTSQAA